MNTRDDLADAGFDAGDLAQFSHVLPALADDDASVLGADEGTEGEDIAASWRRGTRHGLVSCKKA